MNLNRNEIKNLKNQIKKNSSLKTLREAMEVISNEDRFTILNHINKKPCLISDIEKLFDKNQASIAHHLRILEKNNLIISKKKGKFKQYSISREMFAEILRIWKKWFQEIRSRKY